MYRYGTLIIILVFSLLATGCGLNFKIGGGVEEGSGVGEEMDDGVEDGIGPDDGMGGGSGDEMGEVFEEEGASGGDMDAGSEDDGSSSEDVGSSSGDDSDSGVSYGPQTTRLRIINACDITIWIQQQNMPAGVPAITELAPAEKVDFSIPAEGLAATRFWPKTGCDASGNDCKVGQSSPPCPADANGCHPPVDSKFEATWACTHSDASQCDLTPQGDPMPTITWYNASAVDGYTLPFKLDVDAANPDEVCASLDCSGLNYNQCPTNEDLSQGQSLVHPGLANEDLRLINLSGDVVGCYSPCKYMNYPTWNGLGLSEFSDEAVMYCCPTPPIGPAECSAGPVATTSFVNAVHQMCGDGIYGYAYDDGIGLHTCPAETKFTLTFGPDCS